MMERCVDPEDIGFLRVPVLPAPSIPGGSHHREVFGEDRPYRRSLTVERFGKAPIDPSVTPLMRQYRLGNERIRYTDL